MGCQNQSDLLHSHHCDHDYSFTFTFCHLVLWRLWVGVKGQILKWLGKKTLKISWTVLLLNRNFSMPSMQRCDCSPNNHWNFRTKRNPTTEQNFNQFLFVCLFLCLLISYAQAFTAWNIIQPSFWSELSRFVSTTANT